MGPEIQSLGLPHIWAIMIFYAPSYYHSNLPLCFSPPKKKKNLPLCSNIRFYLQPFSNSCLTKILAFIEDHASPNSDNHNLSVNMIFGNHYNYVEQTAHAFLEQQGRRKSQCKMKGGCQ